MNSVPCNICGSRADQAFRATVLGSHSADFFQCRECGFLQTPQPSWLEEAYRAAIVVADTGLVQRNITLSRVLSMMLYFLFSPRAKFLDIAGGYGLFVRLMRDIGFDYYWSDRYCENLLARGFEAAPGQVHEVVTAFEVIEHLPDPLQFMREAFAMPGCQAIVFSTELFDGKAPAPGQWWYYAFEAGQHVSFYQRRTLQALARTLGKQLNSHGSIHMLSDRRVNPIIFALLSNTRLAKALSWIPSAAMSSLTVQDHLHLIKPRAGREDIV